MPSPSMHAAFVADLVARDPDAVKGSTVKRKAHYAKLIREAAYHIIPCYISRDGTIFGDIAVVSYEETNTVDLYLIDRRQGEIALRRLVLGIDP